jgi:Flp pilus assembly protein TadG
MINSGERLVKDTRGVALAELALVLPLFMLLLLGMFDFGKAFKEWIDETHLASEGARLAAVNYCPSPSSDGSGNLVCDWSSIGCGNANPNVCLAQYIDNQASSELKNGRLVNSYAHAQNRAKVCIAYPNGTSTQVGDPVKVTLQVNYYWLNYVFNRLKIASTMITSSATMRLESKPYSGVPLNTTPSCYPSSPAGT